MLNLSITWSFKVPEVDVRQNKVDDRRAVAVALLGLEDIAFLQTFPVEHLGVDLWEGQLVHAGPLLCQKQLLGAERVNLHSL